MEYSMRYESIVNPPLDSGAAQTRATWLSLAVAEVGRTAVATDMGVPFTTVDVALPDALVGVMRTKYEVPTVKDVGLPAVPTMVTLVTPAPTVVAVAAMLADVA
jgi:hypothetical protein